MKDKRHGHGIIRYGEKTFLSYDLTLELLEFNVECKNYILNVSLMEANGNWYEGGWREGKKHGKGEVYYPDKGQLYEGLWVDGDAKCGTFCDFEREKAVTPTKYPIPQVKHFKLWFKSNLFTKASLWIRICLFFKARVGGCSVGSTRGLVSHIGRRWTTRGAAAACFPLIIYTFHYSPLLCYCTFSLMSTF